MMKFNNKVEKRIVKGEIFTAKLTMEKSPTGIKRRKIFSAADAYAVFAEFWDWSTIDLREEFHMLMLNRANFVVGHALVSIGGTTGTIADGKLIFSTALKFTSCQSLVFAHNHPSTNLKPSEMDIKLTKDLNKFGKLIGMPVLDHIIMSSEGFYSFANESITF